MGTDSAAAARRVSPHGTPKPFSPAQAAALDAPERTVWELTEGDLTIAVDAQIVCPQQDAYPVYVLEKAVFTQEEADRMLAALIGDAPLYELSGTRTQQVIQQEIDRYTAELPYADEEAKEIYLDILAELTREKAAAPEQETAAPASRTLAFKESEDLTYRYAREVKNRYGGLTHVWTDAAREQAAADGNVEISGTCTLPDGRVMRLAIRNRPQEYSSATFSRAFEDPNQFEGLSAITAEEAAAAGGTLLAAMGIDGTLLSCAPSDGNGALYALSYGLARPGAARMAIDAAPLYNRQAEYQAPLHQERIELLVSANGVEQFIFDAPARIAAVEVESARLLPWDEVEEIVKTGLLIRNLWDYEDENVAARRLTIERIGLSYLQVRRDAGQQSTYYLPVWDVVGTMEYRYADGYVPAPGGFAVDESGVRTAYAACSVLTVNAIDGSIIDRQMGF